jgi:vancomycin permeability regulator SanA
MSAHEVVPAAETAPAPTPAGTPGRRRWRRRLAVATGLVALMVGGSVLWVQASGHARTRSADDVEPTPLVLVLGAGLRPDGTPSTFLARRLDMARELFEAGKVEVILVSGDASRKDYDEPTAMHDWLVAHGVPAQRVVRDYAGLDTHDSCFRARNVFGVDRAIVVTQDYHLRRALFSCAAAGLDAVGVGVSAASVEPAKAVWYRVREMPASAKAAWDGLTRRDPKFLGDQETGVQDALASPRE